jgi:hypothetical protein
MKSPLTQTGPLTQANTLTQTGPLIKTNTLTQTGPLTQANTMTQVNTLTQAGPLTQADTLIKADTLTQTGPLIKTNTMTQVDTMTQTNTPTQADTLTQADTMSNKLTANSSTTPSLGINNSNSIQENNNTISILVPGSESIIINVKDPEIDEKTNQLRKIGFFIFAFISIPFIICNFYFAATDTSCVHQTTPDFKLPYSTILIVDAVLTIAFLLGIVVIRDKYLGMFLFVMYQIFVSIWTIILCIVFFSFMNIGKDCSRPVYTYILTTLILKLIGQLNLICQSSKKD